MRRLILLPLVIALPSLISLPAFGQTSVATDPVGFTTVSCLGNSDTLASIPFTRPTEFVGAIASAAGSTITVSGTPWVANQFVYVPITQPKHYYALIGAGTSNPKQGHTYFVNGNGANTLTVDTTQDNLNGIVANTQILLIPYWTPATLFPASDANVSFTPTTSTTTYKTQLLIPDYAASGINLPYSPIYFFSNNVNGSTNNVGWRAVGNNTADRGDDPLLPDGYMVVRHQNGAPSLPLTSVGAMLMKKLAVPLMTTTSQAQDNPVSILRPLDVALNATGLKPDDGSFVSGDQLLLFNNAQVGFDKSPSAIYTYDTRWRLTGDATLADHGPDANPTGSALIIRKAPTADGQPVFWTNAFPVQAISAVSKKTHGTAGVFGINLPLTGAPGTPGIECRTGGPTQVVFTFPTAVTFNNATITSGTGAVATSTGSGTAGVTVNLTGVTNAQRITLSLIGVTDGVNTNDVGVRMGVLAGDTTGNGSVNSSDISQTKGQSGAPVTASNFREDVTVNGSINSSDISLVKSKSGTALP